MHEDLAEKLPQELLKPPATTSVMKQLKIFAATYNVATLGKGSGGFVHYLRQQAEMHGLDLLFLQETRSRKSQMVLSKSHIQITSEAINGVGGLELWLARSHPHKQQYDLWARTCPSSSCYLSDVICQSHLPND